MRRIILVTLLAALAALLIWTITVLPGGGVEEASVQGDPGRTRAPGGSCSGESGRRSVQATVEGTGSSSDAATDAK